MEVAEGGVVHPVEDGGGNGLDPADGDVALAVAGLPAGDEGVGEDDGAGAGGARGEIGPDEVHGRAEDRLVADPARTEPVLHQGGLQVRQSVQRHVPVRVGQHHGLGAAVGVGPQVDPGPADEPGADAEPAGGVVVPGDHHGGHAQVGEPVQGPVVQLDRGQRGYGPVVDVAGDEDGVDLVLADGLDQVVDEGGLGAEQVHAVEGPAEVPVGGVQEPHSPAPPDVAPHMFFRPPGRRGRPRRLPLAEPLYANASSEPPGPSLRTRTSLRRG